MCPGRFHYTKTPRYAVGAGGSRSRATAYGKTTFNMKNLRAELVGDCHAASLRFVLPMTVYTRTSPLVLRSSTDCSYPVFLETAICGNDNKI